MQKKILVVGLFLSDKNKNKIYRSAADQLAELLEKNNYPVIKVSKHVGKIFRFVDTIFTIVKSSSQYSIAIVPLYGGPASLFWAEAATTVLKLLKKKVVIVVHGGSIPLRLKTKEARGYLRVVKKADVIACPSNYIIEALKEHQVKSILIENVLNLDDYSFHSKEKFNPKILWMRTFEDVYNPLMAVKVFVQLKLIFSDAKMVMAGHDRGMFQQTIDLAKQLEVFDSIEFPGYISNQQKNNFAEDFDFYICTNQIDNAPVTIIEMMALGLPIITVDSGGIPFIVENNVTGKVMKYDDVDAMVDAIKFIIENPEEGKRIIANAKEYAKQYGEASVIKKWKNVFDQLV